MSADYIQIERLKAEIGLKQAALAEYRAELAKLQREIDSFARQYERIVGPLEAELDAVRQQIEALRARDEPPFDPASIWGGYSSIEESFEAKYGQQARNTMITPQRPAASETELRATYRKLARQYHPDTSTDPAEKLRLTVIMAQVNAAYRAKNLDELYALDGKRTPTRRTAMNRTDNAPVTPLHRDEYAELKALGYQLDDDVMMVKSEHQRLMTSPLMSLKIENSLARSQGRDLLREIAARVRTDLDAARAELTALRRVR